MHLSPGKTQQRLLILKKNSDGPQTCSCCSFCSWEGKWKGLWNISSMTDSTINTTEINLCTKTNLQGLREKDLCESIRASLVFVGSFYFITYSTEYMILINLVAMLISASFISLSRIFHGFVTFLCHIIEF